MPFWKLNGDFFFPCTFQYKMQSEYKIFIILNRFFNLFFYWRIITLQNYVFYVKPQHESAIDIHKSPPFWIFPPSPAPSHPSRLTQSPCLSFLSHRANSHWLSILHMVMYVSLLLSPYLPTSPSSFPSCVPKSVLNICVSTAALQVVSSVPSF